MWDIRACRGCLAVGVKLEKLTDAQKQIFNAVTDLKMNDCDGYPTYFCVECRTILKKVQAFRRRCKRAYYIMKEIMIVRKEVTYSDISLVNRKKTNLKSSLGFWDRNKTACYSVKDIDQVDITLELSLTQQQNDNDGKDDKYLTKLVKYEPIHTAMSVQHIMDIKPDKEEDERQKEIEELVKDIHEETADNDYIDSIDAVDNNTDSNSANVETIVENLEDIDMEDIFKGLNLDEGYDDEDDWLPDNKDVDQLPVVKKKVRSKNIDIETMKELKKNDRVIVFNGNAAKSLARVLINTDIRILSVDEQMDVRQKLLLSESYNSARFKCAVCITTFTSKDTLINHLHCHNYSKNDAKGSHICKICADKYITEEDLKGHMYRQHVYEYKCKVCNAIEPNLQSICNHFQNSHKGHLEFYQIDMHFDVIKLKDDELHEAAKAETDVNYKYKCQICNYGFDSHTVYRDHLTQHEDIPTLFEKFNLVKCEICDLNMEKRKFKTHMERFHNYKYKCKKCDRVLYNRKRAVDHLQEHDVSEYAENETLKLTCPKCDKVFLTPFQMHNHILKHMRFSTVVPKEYCNQCGASYSTKFSLYEHQLLEYGYVSIPGSVTGDPENNCEKCNIQFVNRKSYIMHLMYTMHEEVNSIENICTICKQIFDNKEDYLSHTDNCKRKGKYPRKCNYCDYIIKVPQGVLIHFNREHPGLEYKHVDCIICEQCGKSVTKNRLTHHQKQHIVEEAKFLQCDHCSINLETPTAYTNHVINEHTPNPFYCTVCKYSYKYRYNCREHLMAAHSIIKPFGCDVCDKRLGTLERITLHYKNIHKINFRVEKPELYKSYIPARAARFTVAVYPLMKINASLVRKEILEKTDVTLYDYTNRNGKTVHYEDYLSTEPLEVEPFKQAVKKGVKRKHKSVEKGAVKILSNEAVNSFDFKNSPKPSKEHATSVYTMEVDTAVRKILTGETSIFDDDIKGDGEYDNYISNDNDYSDDNFSDDNKEITIKSTESSARVRNVYDNIQKHDNSWKLMNEYSTLLQENSISLSPELKSKSDDNKEITGKHTFGRNGNKAKVRKVVDDIQDTVDTHKSINKRNMKTEENMGITPSDPIFIKHKTADEENKISKQLNRNKKLEPKVKKLEVKTQNIHKSISQQKHKTNIPSNSTFKTENIDDRAETIVLHTLRRNENVSKVKNIKDKTQKSINQHNRILQENKSIITTSPILKQKRVSKEVENVKNVQAENQVRSSTKNHIAEKCEEEECLKEDNAVVLQQNDEDSVVHEEVVIDDNFQIIVMNDEQYVVVDDTLYKVEVDHNSDD